MYDVFDFNVFMKFEEVLYTKAFLPFFENMTFFQLMVPNAS